MADVIKTIKNLIVERAAKEVSPPNIHFQLRKSISMRGQHPVQFADGSTHHVSVEHAHKALAKIDSLKRPQEKQDLINKMGASHSAFKQHMTEETIAELHKAGDYVQFKTGRIGKVLHVTSDGSRVHIKPNGSEKTVEVDHDQVKKFHMTVPPNEKRKEWIKEQLAKNIAETTFHGDRPGKTAAQKTADMKKTNGEKKAKPKQGSSATKPPGQVAEQNLDELSRKTLGSYIKKASKSMGDNEMKAAMTDDSKRRRKYEKKSDKRYYGIQRAADRLMKEGFNIIEAQDLKQGKDTYYKHGFKLKSMPRKDSQGRMWARGDDGHDHLVDRLKHHDQMKTAPLQRGDKVIYKRRKVVYEQQLDESHYHSVWYKQDGKWMHHFDADSKEDARDEKDSLKNDGYKHVKVLKVHKSQADWRNPQHVAAAKQKLGHEDLTVKEEAPPGREKQVKALKKIFKKDPSAAFAIAWSSYNKAHGK